ncbi:MAG TPA: hypothetical protein HPP76_01790 [Desulfuromonadales bacterium]|nr:hypothetical protein [Desulfuromonadales bacterium]
MRQQEIVRHLSRITDPSVIIYTLTMHDVLTAIVRGIGSEALTLSQSDLNQAKEEVVAALEHHLDIREYIDIGVETWNVNRKL